MIKEKNLLEKITDIYIFIIIIIFPLVVDKTGFFHILEIKWHFFVILCSTYIIFCILSFLYYLVIKKINLFKNYKLSIIQIIALVYLLTNILSTILSPYYKDYDLFIGVGRGEGLIVTSLYILSFLFISFFGKFKKRHLIYFSLISLIHSCICILQYIGFNPFNMYQDGIGTHNVSFMGTIGNIDFISAFYVLCLPISICSYLFLNDNKKCNLLYLFSIFSGFFIVSIINVLSGKLALLFVVILLLPFIIKNNIRLAKFLKIVALILFAYMINIIINPVFYYSVGKIIFDFQFNKIVALFIIIISIILLLSYILNKNDYSLGNFKKILKWYYIGSLILGSIIIIMIYFISFKSGFIYEIHEILHGNFDDSFGTYRVFLWKRALNIFKDYPILGSGSDSFAVRFMSKYTLDVASIGELTINDTAANVYLTVLVNLGILGLINYLVFIFAIIKTCIKKMNRYTNILLIAFISYLISDLFNLSVVIISPLFWCLIGLIYRSIYSNVDTD